MLEGSVQKAGEAVHINLQLIDTQSDGHLWAESYDRNLKDIFGVERDVAEKVAGALKATLMPEEAARVANVPTQNAEAYDLYLRALAFSNRANDQYGLTRSWMIRRRSNCWSRRSPRIRSLLWLRPCSPGRTCNMYFSARTAATRG